MGRAEIESIPVDRMPNWSHEKQIDYIETVGLKYIKIDTQRWAIHINWYYEGDVSYLLS